MSWPRVIYYDHTNPDSAQEGFRSGDAGFVAPDRHGGFETDVQVEIPPNSLHALEQHGVVTALNELSFVVGPIRPGRDAVLRPVALDAAAHIFYEADRMTYGREWEFVIGVEGEREYRLVIDNREYQRTLSRLQFLVTSASRRGLGVRLRL